MVVAAGVLAGSAFLAGTAAASARLGPRHPTMLTGADWRSLGSKEKDAYLSGFLAGAAAEQVHGLAAAGGAADSSAVSSGAIARLRAAKQLHFPYAPSVYTAQVDDYYWWANHVETPIVDVMISVNRDMMTAHSHDAGP